MMRQPSFNKHTESMIPNEVLDTIEHAIADISFGSVTLIVQDARVIQMEKLEKIRFGGEGKGVVSDKTMDNQAKLRERVVEAVRGLQYGQIVILIKDGRATQIERTQKQRVTWVEGRYGDGI